jgi:hypothetical protein
MRMRSLADNSKIARMAATALALAVGVVAVAGCADSAGPWPKMSDFTRINQRTLTPQEQEQAIKGMSEEQQAAEKKAIKKIESTGGK